LHFEAQNFTRLALSEDFKGAAADFAIGREPLHRDGGINDKIKFLSAKRALDGFGNFHITFDRQSTYSAFQLRQMVLD